MTDPDGTVAGREAVSPGDGGLYAPYGQLIKMLLPRAGSIAFYGADEELLWCSDGCERPDLKTVLADLRAENRDELAGGGAIRSLSGGGSAFVQMLRGRDRAHRGTVVVELDDGHRRQMTGSMVASLLRPVLDCIEDRVEAAASAPPAAEPAPPPAEPAPRLDESQTMRLQMLVGNEADGDGAPASLETLVGQCVEHLGCVLGALIIPDRNLTVSTAAAGIDAPEGERALSITHKHLLAWVQLHDKPMVVNRVVADRGADKAPPYKIVSCPLRDPNGRVVGLLGLFRAADAADFEPQDVNILELMSRKAMNLLDNRYDALTGLPNRYAFEHEAQARLRDADRRDGAATLLYLDIDGLNVVNSAFGFHAGDEIIQRLAVIIRDNIGARDLAGRLGGDRFVIMRPPGTEGSPEALAERLRSEMGQLTYLHGERAMPVSVSVGIGRSDGGADTISHVIAAAEYACKRAKELGRNRVEISHADNAFAVAHRSDALAFASLQSALKANRFGLEVQSIHRLDTGAEIVGHEVLMRMREGQDLVGPDKFLAAAERYHLMPALDRWVIAAALRALDGGGAPLLEEGWISLNVSAQSFQSESFRNALVEQLAGSGLPLDALCIELRESSAAHHMREAEALIHSLNELGVKVALDDFGRGLSSLAYLRTLPVQYIKIDGDLVRRVACDRLAESMVLGVAQAAASLGVETIAEHVETEEIYAKLRELNIDYGQGYHLARPRAMPPAYGSVPQAKRSVS